MEERRYGFSPTFWRLIDSRKKTISNFQGKRAFVERAYLMLFILFFFSQPKFFLNRIMFCNVTTHGIIEKKKKRNTVLFLLLPGTYVSKTLLYQIVN